MCSSDASAASAIRFAAVRCGTWETTATSSSWRSGGSATRSAPKVDDERPHRGERLGIGRSVGVSTHVAPANRSASAPSGPSCSDPAIGWPPTKRGWPTAATIGPFTPPTSVTTSAEAGSRSSSARATSAIVATGVATKATVASRSSPSASTMPSSSARAARTGSRSRPLTCQPAARRASPIELPIRPRPTTSARPAAPRCSRRGPPARDARGPRSLGEVVAEHRARPRDRRGGSRPAPLGVAVHQDSDAQRASRLVRRARWRRGAARRSRPRPRAAVAGKAEVTSSVAVNMMLTRSSWATPLRSSIALRRAPGRGRCTCSAVSSSSVVAPRMARSTAAIGREPTVPSATARGGQPRLEQGAHLVDASSARQRPGRSERSVIGPIRVRTSRTTGWPTASHIRRTWRLRPSWIDDAHHARGRARATRAGAVDDARLEHDALAQAPERPGRRVALELGEVLLLHAVARVGEQLGESRRRWCSTSSPSVGESSRPTGKTRGSAGTSSSTRRAPLGVARRRHDARRLVEQVVDEPGQDPDRERRRPPRGRARASTRRPSAATSPFTVTRPSAISSSQARRRAETDPGEHLLQPLALGSVVVTPPARRAARSRAPSTMPASGTNAVERRQVLERVEAETLQEQSWSSRTGSPVPGPSSRPTGST